MRDRTDLLLHAGTLSQDVDAFIADQRRIDVENNQPRRPTAQSGWLDSDINAQILGRLHENPRSAVWSSARTVSSSAVAGSVESWVIDSIFAPSSASAQRCRPRHRDAAGAR